MKIKLFLCCILPLAFLSDTKAQDWKTYPYHEEGSVLFFPEDEGHHPEEPIEWWYTNASVTGDISGIEYSFMLTYFYFPALGLDGFRIFNIADETSGAFFDETLPCNYSTLSTGNLEIQANVFGAGLEEWVTQLDSTGKLMPFQYHISAAGQYGAIDLVYNTLKRPLMVGDTGFFYQGAENYTYYYSQTAIQVSGTLTFEDVAEPVSGTAWIDRQYGNFNPNFAEKYEWFSLQLSNGMDINLWNLFTDQNEIPDTSTYRILSAYVNDSTAFTTSGFKLERLAYIWMPGGEVSYSRQWRLSSAEHGIDLYITARNPYHEVNLPFRFYEGTTLIEGAVNGMPVTGHGFAELLHHYEHPQIEILLPNENEAWDASQPIAWQLLNPDDGRPVFYDLEISSDDKETYTKIGEGLTETEFLWDASAFPTDSLYWFRVTAYSVDSTLVGSKETDIPYNIVTATFDVDNSSNPISIYPNPVAKVIFIDFRGEVVPGKISVKLNSLNGQTVKSSVFESTRLPLELKVLDCPPGVYFLEIQTEKGRFVKKIDVVK